MAAFFADRHFVNFRDSLEAILEDMVSTENTNREEFDAYQKKLVEKLVRTERKFKKELQNHSMGAKAYEAFLFHILDENRTILSARTYFRERQTNFDAKISSAIRDRDLTRLYEFDINYTFIRFVLSKVEIPQDSNIHSLARKIHRIREELIVQNLPLAIYKATRFRAKTPPGHLSFMDFQGIAAEALCNSVDKYCLPYTTAFRDVILGRITGDLIEGYSETMVHFAPTDKRKIYRARKSLKNKEPDSFIEIARDVNSGPKLSSDTNPNEIMLLMSASTVMSVDANTQEDDGETETSFISHMACPDDDRPDVAVSKTEQNERLADAYEYLTIFEKKLLKLKGFGL